MKRTLLAIGFAVLVSMLLAPHGDYNRGRHTRIEGFGPFFITELPALKAAYEHVVEYRRKPTAKEILDGLPPPCPGQGDIFDQVTAEREQQAPVDCSETRKDKGFTWADEPSHDSKPWERFKGFDPNKYLADKTWIVHHATVKEPAHWEWRSIGTVMIDMLVLQAVFLAILFAML